MTVYWCPDLECSLCRNFNDTEARGICEACDFNFEVWDERCFILCGDGSYDLWEECDDGNLNDSDGCNSLCLIEEGFNCGSDFPSICNSLCGDGIKVIQNEECDDSNSINFDGCSSDCLIERFWSCFKDPISLSSICNPICGDGVRLGIEYCDDGNLISNDGCSSNCSLETGWDCYGFPSKCFYSCGD